MQNQYCLLSNIDSTTVPKPFVKWAAECFFRHEILK